MQVKIKQFVKFLFTILKKHYLFVLCMFFMFVGFNFIQSSYWRYQATDAEMIGGNIRSGLRVVAGAILIGSSLLCLSFSSKKKG
ncbi:hypothetical protein L1D33_04930 [Vibrio chagasii]|uniref:hypothetical protein n=1 Tax=Vibrio chagasii TaxID=170679 RepID=UPI001EFE994B|nr:hypothetical protein [Vibrio chagasii]MCG9672904.1 hypothetical protein [Vibrio chagasii]